MVGYANIGWKLSSRVIGAIFGEWRDHYAPDARPTTLPLGNPKTYGLDPFTGTSAAAPVVAGIVALMLQANNQWAQPNADNAGDVETGLVTGAIPMVSLNADLAQANTAVTNALFAKRSFYSNSGAGSSVVQ